mgnify:CR=1 FL=1
MIFPFGPAPSGAAGPPADAASKYNRPDKDWYEGPARYILSREEEKQYRALATGEERLRFIEDFWARRDEDPSTPANESEIRFWKRVSEADGSFHDAPYPGWKTDRGKLHILLGPPDEIREGIRESLEMQEQFNPTLRDPEAQRMIEDMTVRNFAPMLKEIDRMRRDMIDGLRGWRDSPSRRDGTIERLDHDVSSNA